MAGPVCSAEPPHWLNGEAGGGSERRARLIGLSQYNCLPQRIHIGEVYEEKEEGDGQDAAFDELPSLNKYL